MITIQDVFNVANSLKQPVTKEEAEIVLKHYEEEQRNDPTATWDLIVEQCLYSYIYE